MLASAARGARYHPTPGSRRWPTDHPAGKACDIVFGTLGQFPTGADKDNGDRLAQWLTTNADTYIIWQGRIWSATRAEEGWRPYSGGDIYDPADPTGGHHDHIHWSQQ